MSLRRHERGRGNPNGVQLAHRLRSGAVFVTNDHSEVDPRFLNRLREGSIAFNGIYLGRVTVVQAPYEYESRLSEMFPEYFGISV